MSRRGRGLPRLTPARARNLVGLLRVLGPVLLPFAVRAAAGLREAYERRRARTLGVGVDELSEFTGRGASLRARIAGIAAALSELRKREREGAPGGDGGDPAAARELIDASERRLSALAAAVLAAERMPAKRRRGTHRAVGAELDRIEQDLLGWLGVGNG